MSAGVQRVLPALEPFYYLKNFELLLSTIRARYADLLLENELRFITQLPRLPSSSRALLARMVMRRGDLFRASKLEYAEIGETRVAAAPLIEAGWVSDRPLLSVRHLGGLLTKGELIGCLKLPRRYATWRKANLEIMLEAQFSTPHRFEDWYGAGDFVYALLIGPLCERFRLMFFGNDRQSWTEFVTTDLGIFRYEKVPRSLQSRPFQTRAHVEGFERIRQCRELLHKGMPLDELAAIIPEAIADCEWLEERRQKLLFLMAREYELAGEMPKSLSMYLECSYRGARTRAVRLKCKTQDWEGARTLCVLALDNPESPAELQFVQRVLPRVSRKLGVSCDLFAASRKIEEFEIFFEGTPRGGFVEYHVRDHLARDLADFRTVRYVENGLIMALFGLLCWPAIFAPVPGAFFHDFHHGPVDLDSGYFYRRRRSEFDECLSHLESGTHVEKIRKAFNEKWGIQSPFVRWYELDKTLLDWALACFPAAHLRAWFEWMLRDVRQNCAGFPDLVQFYPDKRKYRMIEVKGPGDRLQDNQRRLLEYCTRHGMPVSVCHVRWTESCDGA